MSNKGRVQSQVAPRSPFVLKQARGFFIGLETGAYAEASLAAVPPRDELRR
jgi:hypothetical protein